ncbi:MAG: N-acetyltransferase [Proteobacteria bacterium]|nr:MAG: N-acetyltransferase [Pseudomonadota bacterium]
MVPEVSRPMKLNLETPRLALIPLTAGDLDLAIELFTDEAVTRYVGDVKSRADIEREMTDYVRRGAGGCIGIWCIQRREDGEKLGTAVLLPMPVDKEDTDWSLVVPDRFPDADVEIGYLLKRAAWGMGYATEAAARLLRFAFEETPLDRVVAVTDPDNHASRRVLRKIGLRDAGERLAYGTTCAAFSLTRTQWRAMAPE